MSLPLNFKDALFLAVCLITYNLLLGQNQLDESVEQDSVSDSQKSVIFDLGLYQPIPIENSNVGKATEGKLSFKLGVQVFVYKHFFIGGFYDSAYLNVIDQDLVGRYNKSTVTSFYLQLGYEQKIVDNLFLAVSCAPIGAVNYKNIIDRDRIEQQSDNARLMQYGLCLSYNISKNIALYIDYSFRNDNTKIETAPDIQGDFDKIQYHNIGFGIRFFGGNKDAISSIRNP